MRAIRQDGGRASAIGNHPRLPKTVRRLLLLKRRAWRQWRAAQSAITKIKYNLASKRCRVAVRQFLAHQEEQLLSVGPRKFFNHASHLLHPRDGIISLRSVNGFTSTPAEVCAILNEEFAKNFDNLELEATVPNNVFLAIRRHTAVDQCQVPLQAYRT